MDVPPSEDSPWVIIPDSKSLLLRCSRSPLVQTGKGRSPVHFSHSFRWSLWGSRTVSRVLPVPSFLRESWDHQGVYYIYIYIYISIYCISMYFVAEILSVSFLCILRLDTKIPGLQESPYPGLCGAQLLKSLPFWNDLLMTHDGSVCMPYMVTFTINRYPMIPQFCSHVYCYILYMDPVGDGFPTLCKLNWRSFASTINHRWLGFKHVSPAMSLTTHLFLMSFPWSHVHGGFLKWGYCTPSIWMQFSIINDPFQGSPMETPIWRS